MEIYLTVLMLLVHWTSLSNAEDESTSARISDADNSTLTPLLGEPCWNQICPVNQFCNDFFVCQCYDGFNMLNGDCVPCSREFESCITSADCCRRLVCIKGVCRRVIPSLEFSSLAKICLAITASTVMVVTLSLLLKWLLKYRSFERFGGETDSSFSSVNSYPRQVMNNRPSPYNIDEKPPSYEECMNSAPSRLYAEAPPPYVICANVPPMAVPNDSRLESANNDLPNRHESEITPLNVRALEPVISSDLSQTQDSKSDKKQEDHHS